MEKKPRDPVSVDTRIQKNQEIRRLEKNLNKEAKKNQNLQKEIERLRQENEKLKQELRSKRKVPNWVKANKAKDSKSKKKKGPKPGHPPFSRQRPDEIDEEIEIIPQVCPHCEGDLPEPDHWHEHVQVELPPPAEPIVRKYVVGWSYCAQCKKRVSIKDKLSHSQYGPMFHALVSYWKFGLGMTLCKIQQLLLDQYRLKLSRGVLTGILQRSARRCHGAYEDLATRLLDQESLYADETGWRNDGQNQWLWSFSNQNLSYYKIDPTRKQKVVEDVLGKTFRGVLSSDFYGGYNQIDCKKQRCWVHLLRTLREFKEKYPKSTEIHTYSSKLKAFYEQALNLKQMFQQKKRGAQKRYNELIEETEAWIFKKPRHKELETLAKRLKKYRGELYTFITQDIEPTNNMAEREIRPAVLMRKTSYGNRSDQGAQTQAILMSMIRTCQKQGTSFTQFVQPLLRQ